MAPELIQSKKYDTSVDIWSLGVFAYELAEGMSPYFKLNAPVTQIISNIVYGDLPKLKQERYSAEFEEFLAATLTKDPEQRPSAKELLKHRFLENADLKR